jgi:hypothetical protein
MWLRLALVKTAFTFQAEEAQVFHAVNFGE